MLSTEQTPRITYWLLMLIINSQYMERRCSLQHQSASHAQSQRLRHVDCHCSELTSVVLKGGVSIAIVKQ